MLHVPLSDLSWQKERRATSGPSHDSTCSTGSRCPIFTCSRQPLNWHLPGRFVPCNLVEVWTGFVLRYLLLLFDRFHMFSIINQLLVLLHQVLQVFTTGSLVVCLNVLCQLHMLLQCCRMLEL